MALADHLASWRGGAVALLLLVLLVLALPSGLDWLRQPGHREITLPDPPPQLGGQGSHPGNPSAPAQADLPKRSATPGIPADADDRLASGTSEQDSEPSLRPQFDDARIAAMEQATESLMENEAAISWMLERGYDLFETLQSYDGYSDEELQRLADNDDLLATQELGWRAAGTQDLNQARRWHLTAAARGSTQALAYLASHEYTVSFNMQKELRPKQWRKTQAWFVLMAERGDPFGDRLPQYLATLPWPIADSDRAEVDKLVASYRSQLAQLRSDEGRGEFDNQAPPAEVEALAATLDP